MYRVYMAGIADSDLPAQTLVGPGLEHILS